MSNEKFYKYGLELGTILNYINKRQESTEINVSFDESKIIQGTTKNKLAHIINRYNIIVRDIVYDEDKKEFKIYTDLYSSKYIEDFLTSDIMNVPEISEETENSDEKTFKEFEKVVSICDLTRNCCTCRYNSFCNGSPYVPHSAYVK